MSQSKSVVSRPRRRGNSLITAVAVAVVVQVALPLPINAGMSFRGRLLEDIQTELYHPWGVATDNLGNIYVVDTGNHRVIKYGPDLAPIWVKGGGLGSGDGQFSYPEAVAFGNDVIYVADTLNHRVQVFSTGGDFIRKWGQDGAANGDLSEPGGIAVNPCNSNVYVTEGRNNRVSVFNPNGTFISKFGSYGEGGGQFQKPIGITFAPAANGCAMFVADHYGGRIMIFDPGTPGENAIGTFGTYGTAEGQLSFPDEIAVELDTSDPDDGNVYVAESGSNRVSVWKKTGTFTYAYRSAFYSGAAALGSPHGLALDGEGNLFVANTNESDVYKYKDVPAKLSANKFGSRGSTLKQERFAFDVSYNQIDQTCETLGKLTVTVPARDEHVFRLEKGAVVDNDGTDMFFGLSDKQVNWLDQAWSKDRKVTIDGKFSGICSDDERVTKTQTWKA